jgi:hypothetical protein
MFFFFFFFFKQKGFLEKFNKHIYQKNLADIL